jgi:hypothetical protein
MATELNITLLTEKSRSKPVTVIAVNGIPNDTTLDTDDSALSRKDANVIANLHRRPNSSYFVVLHKKGTGWLGERRIVEIGEIRCNIQLASDERFQKLQILLQDAVENLYAETSKLPGMENKYLIVLIHY